MPPDRPTLDDASLDVGLSDVRPTDDLEDLRVRAEVSSRLFGEELALPRIDRFTILERVGAGGAGVVYAAYDPRLDRRVAIKVLHDDLSLDAASARLVREAQAAGRLSHPNVVSVFDVGRWRAKIYLAMDFIQGPTLQRWLADGPHERAAILDVLTQAGRGLAAAHREGIVHRDFKPGNVILSEDSVDGLRARVVDFGLAWIDDGNADSTPVTDSQRSAATAGVAPPDRLTQTGQRMGTPAYMAPEQFHGEATDARTDQFNFCVTLYEALAGERPFAGTGLFELTEGQLKKLPPHVVAPVRRGLSSAPGDRYPTMEALLADLSPKRRRSRWVLAAAGAATLSIAALWAFTEAPACAAEPFAPWTAERRSQTAAAFIGSDVAIASDTWERLARALDVHARRWQRAHISVCEAHHRKALSPGLFDRAQACLSRERTRFARLVASLSEPSADAIYGAVKAAATLDAAQCADPAHVIGVPPAQPGLAGTSRLAADVARARARLVEASVELQLGSNADAQASADAARTEVAPGVFPPLDAEIALMLGRVALARDQARDALVPLREAYRLAERIDYRKVRTRVALQIAEALTFVDAAQARAWAEVARASTQGPETSVRMRIRAQLLTAEISREHGDYADAERWAERAAELSAAELAEQPQTLARARLVQADASFRRGKLADAERLAIQARQGLVTGLGARHPDVGGAHYLVATVARSREQLDTAAEAYAAAIEIWSEVSVPRIARIAAARSGLAMVAEMSERFDEAERQYALALQLLSEAYGPRSSRAGAIHENLGILHARRGDFERAREALHRSLEIGLETLGEHHPDVGGTLGNLGSVLADQGKWAEALPLLHRALDNRERSLGVDHPGLESVLYNLARAKLGVGESAAALAAITRVEAIVAAAYGEASAKHVSILTLRGRILVADGRESDAIAAFERAVALGDERDEGGRGYDRAMARFELAKVSGNAESALRALVELEALGGGTVEARKNIEAWLATRSAPE